MAPHAHRFRLSFDIAPGHTPTVVQIPLIDFAPQIKHDVTHRKVGFQNGAVQTKVEPTDESQLLDTSTSIQEESYNDQDVPLRRSSSRVPPAREKSLVRANEHGRFEHISRRQSMKMRNRDHWIYWFASKSNEKLLSPPPAPWPTDRGLHHQDLFLHHVGNGIPQAWRYVESGKHDEGRWDRLTIGGKIEVPGLDGERIFVVNKQGKPSFVLQGTVAKLYGNLVKA
ncbi:hypothetical protein QCA50_016051 [Cerrena zonata]|uniref:Uncharacterized protein n=1 Tax=Cerrena zonata TaxID=2478898 RepID=A0AAW0FI00_9APHY